MIQENQKGFLKILLITVLFLSSILSVQASSLDQAKEMVENYYLYSKEKNVDAYSELFEREYLIGLYGTDYKEFFTELFNYFEIQEYEIDFEYYTESEESLTLFFNLESKTLIDGESVKMDNGLVALFSKTASGLKLKYVILQETFIEKMNREVMYESAIKSMTEEQSDLKAEAEKKGIQLIDYKSMFEDKLNKNNSGRIWIVIIILAIILGIYLFKKGKLKGLGEKITDKEKLDSYSKNLNKHFSKAKSSLKKNYEKSVPIVKKHAKVLSKKTRILADKTHKSLKEKVAKIKENKK